LQPPIKPTKYGSVCEGDLRPWKLYSGENVARKARDR